MNKLLYKLICLMILVSLVLSQFSVPAEAASYSAKVTADILNVRQKATTNSSIKFKLKQGSTITVTTEKNNWSYITYGKKNGWDRVNIFPIIVGPDTQQPLSTSVNLLRRKPSHSLN